MKRSLLFALGAFIALQPVQAAAQLFNGTPYDVEYLNFLRGSGQGGTYGVQVGPYSGRFEASALRDVSEAPTSAFALYCVDYLHYAGDGLVNVSGLRSGGDLSNTRLNDYGRYRSSAYLASLFDSWTDQQSYLNSNYGGTFSKANVWGGLHAAMWNTANGPATPLGSSQTAVARQYFLGLAATNGGSYSTNGWYVLTRQPVGDLGYVARDYDGTGQEFLMRVAVPEPSTIFLLLTGLVLLVVTNRKRLIGIDQVA